MQYGENGGASRYLRASYGGIAGIAQHYG